MRRTLGVRHEIWPIAGSFRIARGKRRKVRVRLGLRSITTLTRRRRWKVRAVVRSHDSRNVSVTRRSRVTLRAPRGR